MDVKSINAIILAGGQSKRMGRSKAFLPLEKSTFIETLVETLKPLVNRVIISGDPELYNDLGCRVVKDKYANCGPLAGILAGLQASDTGWNFVVSVDSPFIDASVFMALKSVLNNQQVVMAETTEQLMPLIGFYNQSCCQKLEEALKNNQFKVMQVLKTFNTERKMIDTQQHTLLNNINTPEEYQANLQTVSICFFGQLAEIVKNNQIQFTISTNSTIGDVKNKLFKHYPNLQGKVYKMALNNVFVSDQDVLTKQAEIDVLPAFAGG